MPHMEDLLYIRDFLPGYQHHWTYKDHNIPVMIVARYETNGTKTYRQFRRGDNEWIEGMCPSPYPLFGLETLKNSSPFNALLITEGEKCASVLHQLNWPTIFTVLGAQNPISSDWNPIRYFQKFIILRDNDKAGIAFTHTVSLEIRQIIPDAQIFVVNLVKTIPNGDLVDWLQSTLLKGHDWDGYTKVASELLAPIKRALQTEIEENMITIEDYPLIDFKPEEAFFEGLPKKFQLELRPVPPFPLHAFPEEVRQYLGAVSSQYSQVPDYAATTLITCMSGLIGRSVYLQMRQVDSWYETANSWSALVGAPSAKKSPIMRRIFAIFKRLEAQASEEFQKAKKTYQTFKHANKEKEDFDEPPNAKTLHHG